MNVGPWPPPEPTFEPLEGRVWTPRLVADLSEASRAALSYVVVDELFGGMVDLSVTPWPVADGRGRLRFDLAAQIDVGSGQKALESYLERHRHPAEPRRPLRIGDVFAARIERNGLVRVVAEQERTVGDQQEAAAHPSLFDPAAWDWLSPPLYDLSDEARQYSKIAHFTTSAGTLSDELLGQIMIGET